MGRPHSYWEIPLSQSNNSISCTHSQSYTSHSIMVPLRETSAWSSRRVLQQFVRTDGTRLAFGSQFYIPYPPCQYDMFAKGLGGIDGTTESWRAFLLQLRALLGRSQIDTAPSTSCGGPHRKFGYRYQYDHGHGWQENQISWHYLGKTKNKPRDTGIFFFFF